MNAKITSEPISPSLHPSVSPSFPRLAGFRTKLLVVMMLVVSAIALLALYFAQRSLAANVEEDLQREFRADFTALQHAREIRQAALVERSRALARKPRVQQALEEYRDQLYIEAESEMGDITADAQENPGSTLRAQFYRFLDPRGAVIAPQKTRAAGELRPAEEARLALSRAPDRLQIGYLVRGGEAGEQVISEIMALPIVSRDTAEAIGVLVLGFKPFDLGASRGPGRMKSGIWFEGKLHSGALSREASAALTPEIQRAIADGASEAVPLRLVIEDQPRLVFLKALNAGSVFPPAYEICMYSLGGLIERQRQLRWQVLGAGALLLLVGLGASHVASSRLSAPVEKLAVDSERSARFSADASHQLKTPVTVLRAGLEELLANENLTPEECHQISALIHQTYRLSSLIEDLLLLSRMDAGRLKLDFAAVNLTELIEAAIDDLSALPGELEVGVETDFPAGLHIVGEKRYTTIILHNLLENARKYNRRGGRIRIAAAVEGEVVRLTVGNTGRPIASAAREHIFERFHRGAIGENVPGYGLGLNLARELARLHQGDLRLTRSDESWTEFEVRFRLARRTSG